MPVVLGLYKCFKKKRKEKNWAALCHEWHTFYLSVCRSWQSAMKNLGRKKKNWAALCHEQHTFYLSTCHSWQSAMKNLGRKKKNWAAFCHERHTFYLSTCHSWQSAMKNLGRKRKIGQHSAMNGTHFICLHAVHGRVP